MKFPSRFHSNMATLVLSEANSTSAHRATFAGGPSLRRPTGKVTRFPVDGPSAGSLAFSGPLVLSFIDDLVGFLSEFFCLSFGEIHFICLLRIVYST
ncbi:hypothetical protein CEXT_35491 [Caerostris extrusa]|uniref:Uncharacterized protein n=1 Tax=Caerostris extrusa TaxID=172846 RepID=A0AAV4UH88_CAEEX|nr:hypothetical protein CEXT_35491 [Caerostris extrusa]